MEIDMTHDIAQLAEAIAKQVRPAIPLSVDLWDSATIAAYLKCSVGHVQQRIVILPDFPEAIRLPSAGSKRGGQPLWKAAQVIAWAEGYMSRRAA
jgi:hypothetical protein